MQLRMEIRADANYTIQVHRFLALRAIAHADLRRGIATRAQCIFDV
jgi:hypothetical protein